MLVPWLRIYLPMQGIRVQYLVGELSPCPATEPARSRAHVPKHHNRNLLCATAKTRRSQTNKYFPKNQC